MSLSYKLPIFWKKQHDIRHLSCVNWRLNTLLRDYLLRFNVQHRGGAALMWAARNNYKQMISKLLQYGAKPFTTAPVHCAAQGGYPGMAELTLNANIDPGAYGARFSMPIPMALTKKYEDTARILFTKLEPIDAPVTRSGHTALHIACICKLPKTVQYLLEAGANSNAQTYKYLYTPLYFLLSPDAAVDNGYIKGRLAEDAFQIVIALLEYNADPHLSSQGRSGGITPHTLGTRHPDPRVHTLFTEIEGHPECSKVNVNGHS